MRTIVTLLLLAFAMQSYGQNGKLFKGTINGSIKVTLYLQGLEEGVNADPLLGAYKYDHRKDFILLNGYHNNDGNVVLVEQFTVNFSGVFMGTINKKTLKGRWISADQKKTYPFELVEMKATKEQVASFQNAMDVKAQTFRNY
jgi:hypothetical protein